MQVWHRACLLGHVGVQWRRLQRFRTTRSLLVQLRAVEMDWQCRRLVLARRRWTACVNSGLVMESAHRRQAEKVEATRRRTAVGGMRW